MRGSAERVEGASSMIDRSWTGNSVRPERCVSYVQTCPDCPEAGRRSQVRSLQKLIYYGKKGQKGFDVDTTERKQGIR